MRASGLGIAIITMGYNLLVQLCFDDGLRPNSRVALDGGGSVS